MNWARCPKMLLKGVTPATSWLSVRRWHFEREGSMKGRLLLFLIAFLLLTIVLAEGYYRVWADPFMWVWDQISAIFGEFLNG